MIGVSSSATGCARIGWSRCPLCECLTRNDYAGGGCLGCGKRNLLPADDAAVARFRSLSHCIVGAVGRPRRERSGR